MKERYCRNCVEGQDVRSRFSLASWVYCSLHKQYKQYYDVCSDHRFVEEAVDLDSSTSFKDWVKKQKEIRMYKVLSSNLLSTLIKVHAWKL